MCTVEDCQKPVRTRSYCLMHYWRVMRHGDPGHHRPTHAERFWKRVNKTDSCWLWTGPLSNWGYGKIQVEGVSVPAHRFAYTLLVGPIPAGHHIDHLCRVRACVNPSHLEPVTIRENTLRGVGVCARAAKATQCPQGHAYSPDNTRINTKGSRECRTCGRDRSREHERRKRAASKQRNRSS